MIIHVGIEIITGNSTSERVLLPRIDLTSSRKSLPFLIKRRQLPIRLTFCLRINKVQDPIFDKFGLYDPELAFN